MKPFRLALILVAAMLAAQRQPMAQEPTQAASQLTVEAVLTTGVVDRQPQDTVTTIATPAESDTLYLWTRVTGAAPGTVIHHVWFRGDEQVADVELTINGSPWRTWSQKIIPAEWTGGWRVEVRDASGTVLQTTNFTVGQ